MKTRVISRSDKVAPQQRARPLSLSERFRRAFHRRSEVTSTMERWSGRVAVVTGASAGIGAAIAEELVKKGLKVVGLARRVERVEDLANSIKSATGKLYPLKCDVSKESEVTEAFKWIKTTLGGVDILINSAGVGSQSSLTDGPVEKWRKIFDLNVLALSVCTKEALQSMKEKGVDDGHIIHINSIVGHGQISHPGLHMYSASKHAVTALTEGLRRELVQQKSKIRVTSVSPGAVRTEFPEASDFTGDILEFLKEIPFLQPKDIADAVIYILGTPPHVQVHELTIKPVGSPS
ncbi:farnesol dehydrogenase-like [Cryptotermes secundus]|uniref:farnesol dehydrogenase-like n=1 Tax=Cryptotermes secundus TaxID=105785 RepID=UPI000CD7B3E6|nr:farnesol dehydrogenase-like [Cryptotermes secundus]